MFISTIIIFQLKDNSLCAGLLQEDPAHRGARHDVKIRPVTYWCQVSTGSIAAGFRERIDTGWSAPCAYTAAAVRVLRHAKAKLTKSGVPRLAERVFSKAGKRRLDRTVAAAGGLVDPVNVQMPGKCLIGRVESMRLAKVRFYVRPAPSRVAKRLPRIETGGRWGNKDLCIDGTGSTKSATLGMANLARVQVLL